MANQFRSTAGILVPVLVFSIVLNGLTLVVPLYMLQVYDRVLVSQSTDTLVLLSVIAVAGLAVFGVLEAVRGTIMGRASVRVDAALGPRVFRAMVLNRHADQGPVDLFRDLTNVKAALGGRVGLVVFDLPFVPFFIAAVFLVHPFIGWLTLGGTALLVLLAALNQLFASQNESTAQDTANVASHMAQALLRNRDELNSMGITENVLGRWSGLNARTQVGADKVSTSNAIYYGASRFVRMVLQVCVLGIGAFLVIGSEMSAGAIFAASMISARALGPIEQIIGSWRMLHRAMMSHARLRRFLGEAGQEDPQTGLPTPEGRIEVEKLFHLSSAPGETRPILEGVSFVVEPGDVIGVVGPSGAGKSTLCRLLVGAETPSRGAVRLDGANIDLWPGALKRRHVGYMAQAIELLPGTVADNICRFDNDRENDSVFDAAKFVGAHDIIARLPDGYDTTVGAGGRQLSGGETQLIALARAFHGDPCYLVLDEPNAHLDGASEEGLIEVFRRAKQRAITIIVTTQRLQLLQAVDKLLVLQNGRVEQFGSRDAVARKLMPQKKVAKRQKEIDAAEKSAK